MILAKITTEQINIHVEILHMGMILGGKKYMSSSSFSFGGRGFFQGCVLLLIDLFSGMTSLFCFIEIYAIAEIIRHANCSHPTALPGFYSLYRQYLSPWLLGISLSLIVVHLILFFTKKFQHMATYGMILMLLTVFIYISLNLSMQLNLVLYFLVSSFACGCF